MSLGFSGRIGEYADIRGEIAAQLSYWYDTAIKFMVTKELWQRLIDVTTAIEINPLKVTTDGQKLAVIILAIANGAEFDFYNEESANQQICQFVNTWGIDLNVDISNLFTPLERLQIGF